MCSPAKWYRKIIFELTDLLNVAVHEPPYRLKFGSISTSSTLVHGIGGNIFLIGKGFVWHIIQKVSVNFKTLLQ